MSSVAPAIRRILGLGPSRGGVVLLYHRVALLDHDPHCLAIPPERFAQHLEVIVEHGVPMSLTEMVARAGAGELPPGAVAITFDDGYADNLLNAAPLLVAAGIPATMFLSTRAIVDQSEFWWDQIEQALITNTIDRSAFDEWCVRLRVMSSAEREESLAALAQRSGASRTPRPSHRPLTSAEVTTLASQPGITVGAHTQNHPSLAGLPGDIQHQEIAESKRVLEQMLGTPVTSFAYPFGGQHDISGETRAAARVAGMTIACSTIGGRVRRATNPLSIPRVLVRNWTADEFAQRFMEWVGVAAR